MIRPVVALLPAFALLGCSTWSMPSLSPSSFSMPSLPSLSALPYLPTWSAIRPYTLDIQQGIVIDDEMIGRLKPGMTRTQVGYVLGTPLLTDPFHANRWDYVFYTRKKGQLSPVHNLTVFFKEDRMDRFETDYPLPAAKPVEAAASAAPAVTPAPAETLPAATRPVTPGGGTR